MTAHPTSRPTEAILLVAGTGTRLHPLTKNCPKCLLEVGGAPLLKRLLTQLEAVGVERVVLATGFLAEKLLEEVASWALSLEVDAAFCESFARTNNAVSLRGAMEKLQGERFLLLDGDILVKGAELFADLLDVTQDNVLSAICFENLGEEEMKIELRPGSKTAIAHLSKGLAPERADGESLGIQKIGPSAFSALKKRLASLSPEEEVALYYEDVFSELIDAGIDFSARFFDEGVWTEIDTVEDLHRAEALASHWRAPLIEAAE